jgi:hypothetical protein
MGHREPVAAAGFVTSSPFEAGLCQKPKLPGLAEEDDELQRNYFHVSYIPISVAEHRYDVYHIHPLMCMVNTYMFMKDTECLLRGTS